MDAFSGSIDLARIVFLLGAVLALIYKKKFGITPGGIIVPGTLVGILSASFATFMIVMFTAALCTFLYKVLFSNYPLSRRWSSLINISMSVVLGLAFSALTGQLHIFDQEVMLFSLVVPGLISISAQKYSFMKVLFGTLSVTAACAVLGWGLSRIISYELLSSLSVQLAAYKPLALENPYLVLPISLIAAILVYFKFGIRGGGYLIAPFLAAVLASSPLQALLIAIGIGLSYLTVRLIQKYTLIIGLERFVVSLFCGYVVISLIDLYAVHFGIMNYRPAPLVLIIAVAVLTNDLTLQSLRTSLKKGVGPSMLISYLTRLAV